MYNSLCVLDATFQPKSYCGATTEFSDLNFLKGIKWSPDGTCLLSSSDDNILRLFELPKSIFDNEQNPLGWTPVLKCLEAETIYDFCWLPCMNSMKPETCFFASTSRDQPVHMWDAFSGTLKSTYRAYDQADEITAAISLAFNLSGTKIYCGYNKTIRIFDTDNPGKEYQSRPTFNSHTKRGQTGIISCFAFSSSDLDVFAAGSYAGNVHLYSEQTNERVMFLDCGNPGITHMKFSADGTYLFIGARRDDYILGWDVRKPDQPLYQFERKVSTNQRIGFDLHPNGRYLVSGSCDSCVLVYDLQEYASSKPSLAFTSSHSPIPVSSSAHSCLKLADSAGFAHTDVVNDVGFHPYYPLLATSSGTRKLVSPQKKETETKEVFEIAPNNSVLLWNLPLAQSGAATIV